jgi:hypothetical protein
MINNAIFSQTASYYFGDCRINWFRRIDSFLLDQLAKYWRPHQFSEGLFQEFGEGRIASKIGRV